MNKSKLSKRDADSQIRRLEHFYGAPKNAAAWLDSIDALVRYCRDLDHCRNIISDYIDAPRVDSDGNPKFPTLYDLRLMCEGRKTKRAICIICNGDGFVPDTPAFMNKSRYERVKRCECNRQASTFDRGYSDHRIEDITTSEMFLSDLAGRPDMIAKWKPMMTAKTNTSGYPLREDQRKAAAKIIKQLEDYLGQAV